MFSEEEIKKDIKRMRDAYAKAAKKLEEIHARQTKIAEKIYAARKDASIKNNKILWE